MNSEFEVLEAFLQKLPDVLNPGGRVGCADLPFREDRLVKRSLKENVRVSIYSDAAKDVIRPSEEECRREQSCPFHEAGWAVRTLNPERPAAIER